MRTAFDPEVRTYAETAAELNTDYRTVSGLVQSLNLTPKPVARNARAKGLDAADRRAIAKALRPARTASAN